MSMLNSIIGTGTGLVAEELWRETYRPAPILRGMVLSTLSFDLRAMAGERARNLLERLS